MKGGHIYIAEFMPMHVKIGKSQHPCERIASIALQSGMIPAKTWVSPLCYNYGAIELKLHHHFQDHRTIGEYFAVAFDDAQHVAENLLYVPDSEKDFFRSWVHSIGGAQNAANMLGVSLNAVHKWLQGVRRPRPNMAFHIEKVSCGKVPKESLIWPQEQAA